MRAISVLFIISFTLFQMNVFSQDSCKVLKPEISGKYIGKCKNGLADGKGIAEGTDKYEGKFIRGLPNGEGKYTWLSGEVYEGSWKNGKRNGKGKYTYTLNGVETVDFGIWADDNFIKKILPDPFTVYRATSITRYTVQRLGEGERVLFGCMQNGGNTNISNVGFYSTSGNSCSVGTKFGYENIDFPCTFKLSYTCPNKIRTAFINVEFEIVIKEPGSWEVTIHN